jgi:N-formylglutamate deformylase
VLREPFCFSGAPASPIVATAIHAGHDLRPEVERLIVLDESTRLREEDPFTDRLAACVDARVVVHRSRFEVDLNRARELAVYRSPEESWGLEIWDGVLPDRVVRDSLALYDSFYARLAEWLDPLAQSGPFVLLDVHCYNHRRGGPDQPPDPAIDNPDINVGTGSLDRRRWASVVETLIETLGGAEVIDRPLDVRENVRFKGAHLARWVHERFPATGCALALEFKKTFMDEWTGVVDKEHLDRLTVALRDAMPACLAAIEATT